MTPAPDDAAPAGPETLEQLLDRVDEVGPDDHRVTLGGLMNAVGRRSFGPLLLLVGLISFSPLSGIPGLPSTLGLIVVLVAVQLLLRRDHFWIPAWIERRSLSRAKLEKAVRVLRRPARGIDRLLRPRLTVLTRGAGVHVIACACVLVGVIMPPLEPMPFAASVAGAVLTIFGLALITQDGALALLGLLLTGSGIAAVLIQLLS